MEKKPFGKLFLDAQHQKLKRARERLMSELSNRGKKSVHDSEDYRATYRDYGSDQESNVAEVVQYETDLSTVEQLEEELRKVNDALERIDAGTYGIDAKIGKPISKKRLEAYPAAEADV